MKETAEEYGIPYRQHPTMTGAIKHHLILLKLLGNEDMPTLSIQAENAGLPTVLHKRQDGTTAAQRVSLLARPGSEA